MQKIKIAIPRKQYPYFIVAVCILIVAVFLTLRIQWQQHVGSPQDTTRYSLAETVNAPFAGFNDTSADAPALNRLIRGKVTEIDESEQTVTIAVYVSFPDTTITRDITFSLTPRTQFLCWATKVTVPDGNVIDVERAAYLLDENTKLFQNGERRIDIKQAKRHLSQYPVQTSGWFQNRYEMSALIALETAYSQYRSNNIFQVALLGCDDK